MATLEENKKEWDGAYNWNAQGDEWSRSWGGVNMQWYGTILPRIHSYIPCKSIVEIACGHGRWTQFLKKFCKHMIAVDLSEKCVNACKKRFASDAHLSSQVTDGTSLPMVENGTADFIFSFDSLVHVNKEVIQAYIREISRILTEDGVAFIHHSNLAAVIKKKSKLERRVRQKLHNLKILKKEERFWRDESVSAELVSDYSRTQGLSCISQEIFPWASGKDYIDCISVLVKKGSLHDRENRVIDNPNMMKDAAAWKRLSTLYTKQ